jgi:hypothetical protein
LPETRRLPPAPGRGPIFIVGAMGSGTTLLRLVLDSHDRIAIPQETGFMRAYNAHRSIPFKVSGRNWARRLGWSRRELDEQLRIFYDTLFMRYAEQHGKQRWGEKTPIHTWHIDAIARLFPDAVFVGIVRHPYGSVASNMRRWRQPLGRSASHYSRYNREIARQAARHGDRFVLVRYEDLVLQPEPLLRELLDWLGEPWSDHVLDHASVQARRGGKLVVEGRSRIDDPIDRSRIDRWTRVLDRLSRHHLAETLDGLTRFLGYAIDDPAALRPLNDRGSLLLGGHEVDARIDRFPEIDIRAEIEPPPKERPYDPRRYMLAPAVDRRPGGLYRRIVRIAMRVPRPVRRRLRAALRRIRGKRPARDIRPPAP